jgi:hypothetical protein
MNKFFTGFVLGIVVATIGITGILNIGQRGVDLIKHQSQELAKPAQSTQN